MQSWLNRYRPLFAADGVAGGAAADAAPVADAGAAAAIPAADAAAAAVSDSSAAPAAPAADAAAAEPKSAPSLLEAADGKKPDAKADAAPAADAKVDGDKPADTPAPADAAKPDGEKPDAAKDAKPDATKDDKPKDDAAKTDPATKDATAEPQPPAPIKYEAFKIPDGVTLDDGKLSQFSEIAGAAQVPQDVAQKFVDMYVKDVQDLIAEQKTEQRRVWDTLNDTWKTDLRKDEVLGGNRLETSLSMAKAVVEEFGGSEEQVRELLAHTTNNGMGNYPGFVRLLHNIGVRLNIFEDGLVTANPQAPKAAKGPGQRGWYDKTPAMGQGNGAAAS